MSFTDRDLDRLKERLDDAYYGLKDPITQGGLCDLIARLEAAEKLITEECDCNDEGHADACSQYKAWLKSKSDGGGKGE